MHTRAALQLEILALRHQLQVLERSCPRRVRLGPGDRLLWAWLSRVWNDWRSALVIVRPEANRLWGAPRVHGEVLKLGIAVSQATVAKYMCRHSRPPSQSWRTFLTNHMEQITAADFFVVPTATGRLLFVLVLLAHHRRHVLHVAITAHPTAAWTAQQMREAFPWDAAPRYLLHDRDLSFAGVGATAEAMAMINVLTAPRAPWQNPYVERLIGSVRRECLDHVIVFNEAGLRRILKRYLEYYERSRTHLSLDKDAPISRGVSRQTNGRIIAIPQVNGLHHRYERLAA
jgi:transposase InsO family protein